MRSIVKSIYEHSIAFPDKTAIIATDMTASYKTLWSYIHGMAKLLQKKGIVPGDRIIVEANHTVEYLVCCYGIQLAGAIDVPVEHNTPFDRIAAISAEIEPKMILTGDYLLEQFDIAIGDLVADENEKIEFPTEDMLQEILFTTGTTGKSKGVMITHYAQMNMCETQNSVLNYSENNVWMIPTPMNHAAGLRKTHMSMVRGSTVLLMNGFRDLKKFFANLRDYRVTSLYLPPAAVHYILAFAGKELAKFDSQLDFLYSSSSALPSGDKEKLIALLPHVRKFDAYGGSEVGAVAYIDYNAVREDGFCVGKPNPGVDISIVDENYDPKPNASKDDPGIIAIRSNTVTKGYWNEPELTAKTIVNGVIYMTDLGYFNDEGYLFLVGRRDDVINIGGFKIAPTEVESIAMQYMDINECLCIPYEDKMFGKTTKLLVCLNEGADLDPVKITEYLAEHLEAYKLPKYIEAVDEILRTYNGKIDRKQMIENYSKK